MSDYLMNLSDEHRDFLQEEQHEKLNGHYLAGHRDDPIYFLVYKRGTTPRSCTELCETLVSDCDESPLEFVSVFGTGDENDAGIACL